MFIQYRCSECLKGVYSHQDSCWEDGCGASDNSECEENFKEVENNKK